MTGLFERLVELLGLQKNAGEVEQLLSDLQMQPDYKYSGEDVEQWRMSKLGITMSFYAPSFRLLMVAFNVLEFELQANQNSEKSEKVLAPYRGDLPGGILTNDTRAQVRDKLGAPMSTSDSKTGHFDEYSFSKYSISFLFDVVSEKIEGILIMHPHLDFDS